MAPVLRRPLALFLVLCALTAIFLGVGLHTWSRQRADQIAVLRDDFGSTRKDTLLKKLGVSSSLPTNTASLTAAARDDLRQVPDTAMRTVAIRVADTDVYDPETGLKANSRKRGRAWERPASVCIRRDGREILAAPTGIRLQGNRDTRDMLTSFRLYFRASYGRKNVPGQSFVDDSAMDIRKIVVRKEKNTTPGFVNMLAFDAARRVGALTPDYAPVRMLVNGRDIGLALASEHVNRTHWERKLGHKDFAFYVFESENSVLDDAQYKALSLRLSSVFGLWNRERVASILDIDNFIRSMLAFAFVQWQDWNQGALILDRTEAHPRWKSVLWDADLAFAGLRPEGVPAKRAGWKNLRDAHGLRARIFKGMWANCPEFRTELLACVAWAVNHRLTPDWIDDRVRHYAELEKASGMECFDEALAQTYLRQRRKDILQETVTDLGAPAIVTCRVESPAPMVIDNATTGTRYAGLYFTGQDICLSQRDPAGFSHWTVNGETVRQKDLCLRLERDTAIEAVFAPTATQP